VKVLLVVHRFPPRSMGGTELYALRLAQGLKDRGDQVRVLTYAEGRTREVVPRDEEYQGIPVRRLSFDLRQTSNPVLEEYDNVRVGSYLRRAFSADRPDLLHVAHLGYLSTSVLAVAGELAIPSVVTITDLWPICVNSLLVKSDGGLCAGPTDVGQCVRCYAHLGPRGDRYARLTELVPRAAWRLMARACFLPGIRSLSRARWMSALARRPQVIGQRLLAAGAILTPGEFVRQMLVRNGYPPARVRRAPHGIADPARLARRRPIASTPKLRFGYAGPLGPHKGALLPVGAFGRLGSQVPATLTYWGPGEASDDSQSYAGQVMARIAETAGATHQGAYPHELVGEVMERLDVLIVPSLWYENTPTIIYEALASGTPVIATDQGGMRELILEHQGGWLFPRGDVGALAALMSRLAESPEEVRRAAEAIRPVPTFAAHLDEVAQVYRQVLAPSTLGASREVPA